MSITHLLNASASWSRSQPVRDRGRQALTPTVVDADLPIRVQVASRADKSYGEQLRAEMSHVAYTDPDAALQRDDLLDVTGPDGESRSYVVLASMPPSKPEHHKKWALQKQEYGSISLP